MRKFKARQQTKNGARACSLSQVQSCGQKLQLSPVGGLLMMIKGFGDWMLDVGDWGLGFQNKEYWPRRKQ